MGYTDAELSILIVDDEEMHRLNLEYRQVDDTTDVLSFPMLEGEFGDISPEMLGDVVISADTAQLMSERHRCPLASIMDLLLAHGILHLAGYDHEEDEEEARLMKEKTLDFLTRLGHEKTDFEWFFG